MIWDIIMIRSYKKRLCLSGINSRVVFAEMPDSACFAPPRVVYLVFCNILLKI